MYLHYFFLIPALLTTSVYSMDEAMEDAALHNTCSENASKSILKPTWTDLATRLIAQHEYTNDVRSDNLFQILKHMRHIKWRIKKLPLQDCSSQQAVIGKIQQVIEEAKDWQAKMNHLLALDPRNQTILAKRVDEFCHDKFDSLQPQFKILVDELDAKAYHPELLDFDAILQTMNSLTLK